MPHRFHSDAHEPDVEDGRPVAVVDIGSNSVRLVVYERLSRAPFPRFNEKSLCALGDAMDKNGDIEPRAFDCTIQALRRFAEITNAMGTCHTDIIATEAVRRARNGGDLLRVIKDETGLEPVLLSGADEARFAALGVAAGFHRPRGIVGDMGGGSLELSAIEDGVVDTRTVSLPLGALPVRTLMKAEGPDAKTHVDALLEDRPWSAGEHDTFYAVGGGWRALARIHLAVNDMPIKVAHGLAMDARAVMKLARSIAAMTPEELARMPGVPRRRIPTLPASALVISRVIRALAPDRVVFSALGVREGWLFNRLSAATRAADPLLAGAADFAGPRSRVAGIGRAMERWTAPLFPDETEEQRRLRVAACLLSDIGWRDHPDARAQESFHRLVNFPFTGIDHKSRAMLALAIFCRYGGKATRAPSAAQRLLEPAEQQRMMVLGRALQLGYRLSGSVPALLGSAALAVKGDLLELTVHDLETLPESDPVKTRLKNLARAIGIPRTAIRMETGQTGAS